MGTTNHHEDIREIKVKLILQSLAGGLFIMATSAIFWLFGVKRFFIWVMAWPALLLRPFFSEPAPDQIFPLIGSWAGIFTALAFAMLVYSLLVYLVLWWRSKHARLA